MKILAIDTATEACSSALWLDGEIHARFEIAGREHTQRLLPQVAALLAGCGVTYAQLDGIVCGVGPGSFAGVRIGVGFVKGIALALDRPVVGVSSLAMLAQGAVREQGAQQVLSVIDARMGEVYFGAYACDTQRLVRPLLAETVCAPQEIPAAPAAGTWCAAGTGWGVYEERLRAAASCRIDALAPAALPHAQDALPLALSQFNAGQGISADRLLPVYLRNKVALTLIEQRALRK
ncbi:MAG: tRNA (adenosine(37)-N6)-threonylcarbamoyltransferase complex dimerization subunit type 1 TsaB [Stenotrophobium sp.]